MSEYKHQTFKMGEVILQEGDQPHCAYIIKSGSVEIVKERSDGGQSVLSVLQAGDLFGEMSMVDAEPRSASVVAREDVTLIVVDAPTFKQKQEALDIFSRKLVKTLIKRLRVQNQQIADMTDPSELTKAAKKGQLEASKTPHTNVLIREDYREKLDFSSIRFILADPNVQSRQGIKGGLHMQGFREIDDVNNIDDFKRRVASEPYDLMVVDASMGVQEVAKVIRLVRRGKAVTSPFAVIFAIIEQPDPVTLETLAEAGLDDVLVKPIALGNIIDRVERRIRKRKPFVVTLDYIGPDRRSDVRPEAEQIPLVEVPNPLSFHALKEPDEATYDQFVQKTKARMGRLTVERYAVQIDWLRGRIAKAVEEKGDPSYFLTKAQEMAGELSAKLKQSNDGDHFAMCAKAIKMIEKFQGGQAEFTGPDWEGFAELTRRLRKGLRPPEDS